jgi:hypothetical protein
MESISKGDDAEAAGEYGSEWGLQSGARFARRIAFDCMELPETGRVLISDANYFYFFW